MNNFFSVGWCNNQLGAKLSGKPTNHSRMSPIVDIPNASSFKSKRKRTLSPEPNAAATVEWKKPRSVTDASQRLPLDVSLLPAKAATEQADPASLAYATPGATPTTSTHRHEYPDNKMGMDLDHPQTSPTRPSTAHPQTAASHDKQKEKARVDEVMEDAHSIAVEKDEVVELQQMISNTYDMQILLKHDELRLIEQELAKCQVALEQLRRCELRPFPGDSKPSLEVSTGTGPAVLPAEGYTKPSHAAPSGVTDGPYSRHYRHWLLPDPQFDPQPVYAPSAAELAAQAANRSTRNSGSARKPSGKSLAGHQNDHQFAHMPCHPPPVAKKEKSGPLILRRLADGKLVKLVCNDCQRGDMNSIQGFLNHCRIAHKVEYKSHEAAAVDCGRVLDEQEIATLPAETQATPAPKPTTRHTPARAPTVVHHIPANTTASVHPYNTPNASIPQASQPQRQLLTPIPARPAISGPGNASPFKPSTATPRLSAIFAKNNFGGDLNQAVATAKQRVDIGINDHLLSPEASSPSTPFPAKSNTPSSTQSGLGVARPSSHKGYRQPTQQRPRPSPLAPVPAATTGAEIPDSPHDSHLHVPSLSPHAADSEPGLISDLEDDDHGSASEEESHPLPTSRGPVLPVTTRTCGADADPMAMDVDVSVDDEIDEQGVIILRNSMLGVEDRGLRSAGGDERGAGGKRPLS